MSGVTFDLFRDHLGIPHVRAASELEVAYGQGWVTAQDRGLQIEADRLRAEGRYAELAGDAGVAWDRFAERERLAGTARAIHDAAAPAEQAWLAAYADGVTAGLRDGGRDVPELAGVPGRPWEPWTPIGVFLAVHVLFNGFPGVLWRAHVARHLRVPGVPLERVLRLFDAEAGSGSNAWAVTGAHTVSGRPLVAGDPHRTLEVPGPYQQVRLVCTDPDAPYDVAGLAFPGVPGVPHFAHAVSPQGSVAWGITNAGAHHVEVVADDPDDPAAWRLAWPARDLSDVGVAAWRALLHARTARDVADAFTRWVDPVNRVLTADDTGEVLSLTAGRVPAARDRALPVARPADGYVELPPAVTVTEAAVDANERPVTQPPDGRPGTGPRDLRPAREAHDLGWWYPPHRAERIRQLLAAAEQPESPDTQSRIHGDTRDLGAAGLVVHLAQDPSPAAGRLRAWVAAGAHLEADSTDAALYMRWRHALAHRVARHPALAPLHAPHGQDPAIAPLFAATFDVAVAAGSGTATLLDADWLGIDGAAEASGALAEVADASAPAWGDLHAVAPTAPAPGLTGAHTAAVRAAAVAGNNESVRCTGGSPGVATTSHRGSVARYVWDLSDRSRSRWGVPFGADGRPGAPHFDDQHATWAAAGTVPVVTDPAALYAVDTTGRLLNGPRGAEVWRQDHRAHGVVTAHVVDPDADADLLHGWFTQPRAAFWGLGDRTRDEVRDLYAFVDSLETHHAYLLRWDGAPVALVQAYHPEHDPVVTAYDVAPGDLGVHFFRGGNGPAAGGDPWPVLGPALRDFLFAGRGTARLVAEPDARNTRAVRRLQALGFTAAEEVSFVSAQGPKTARMTYLTREAAYGTV